MKFLYIFLIFITTLYSEELKIKANYFESDEKKGITIFKGDVYIKKGFDEINASKVVIYTNEKREPLKYIAEGNVNFKVEDDNKNRYKGKAQKVIYNPVKDIYEFYNDVYLTQLNDKKEITGDEVFLDITASKAYAKGVKNKPVIMIFDIKEDKKK
jgi:lipopolysaccharide export system protein LptA